MKKSFPVLVFLIFVLSIVAAAGEDIDTKSSLDLIFNVTDMNDTVEIHVILPADANGSVRYSIDGKNYKINVSNGDAPLSISDLSPGNYTLKANYTGNDKYISVENKTSVTVLKKDNATVNESDKNKTDFGINETGIKNSTVSKINITNRTSSSNGTAAENNTTVGVVENHTQNITPTGNRNDDNNIETAVDNSQNKPQSSQNNQPFKLDAKTGIPLLLVIIAIAILIGVNKYDF